MPLPIFDLHCDLLSYITGVPHADPVRSSDIGSSLLALQAGNVKLQTMAIYVPTEPGSVESGIEQSVAFLELLDNYADYVQHLDAPEDWADILESDKITIVAAIENANAFCGEEDHLDDGLAMLETMLENTGGLLYISLTHNDENRFGGGNNAPGIGLKEDGQTLLEFMDGMNIAVDISHTSDALARDILEYINRRGLDVPVLASHSNARGVHPHVRNLPDDIAQEIIQRGGLIGVNFYRDFVHHANSDMLYTHILYILQHGGGEAIAFGSDFFFSPRPQLEAQGSTSANADFFEEMSSAAQFPKIIDRLEAYFSDEQEKILFSEEQIHRLAFANVYNFLYKLWG